MEQGWLLGKGAAGLREGLGFGVLGWECLKNIRKGDEIKWSNKHIKGLI